MQLQLNSTEQIVEIVVNGVSVPARVWTGETASGVAVQALITRVAVSDKADTSDFERELLEQHAPALQMRAFSLRMIL